MARPKAPLFGHSVSPLSGFPIDLRLDRQAAVPMHAQLAEQLRSGVLSGALAAGLRLPGSRALAGHFGVTRGVVAEAYAELVADGTLTATVGSGTRVSSGAVNAVAKQQGVPAWFVSPPPAPIDDVQTGTGLHFKTGVTTSATLDERVWRQAWAFAAKQGIRGDYSDVQGEPEFRAAIAAFVGRSRGLPATANDVLVTSGTLQALNLIVRGVLPPGSEVLVENPGYRAARQVFVDAGHTVHALPLDDDGAVISPDLPAARLIYVTPSHQFPLGVRMSLPRRLALLRWAEEHDALIIEDDYNGEFRYGAPPLPPLASLDTCGRVLYVGTLSKVLTPAVRTGFVVAPPALMPVLVRSRTLLDFGHPLPLQHALSWLLMNGEVDRHIRRSRRWHAQVREALTRELAPLEPQATLGGIEAGLHVCLHLRDLNAETVKAQLIEHGVYVTTVAEYGAGGKVPNALLLGYGGLTVAQAVAGAREIVALLQREL